MLGVTSINRCGACDRVHRLWARSVGLRLDDPDDLAPDEAAAYAYGQAMALGGPVGCAPPNWLPARHQRELEAAALLMELANLTGNRFLPERRRVGGSTIGQAMVAHLYDVVMRVADRGGLGGARRRTAGGARGDVLEIGIGSGLNLGAYSKLASLHGIDPNQASLAIAGRRATGLGRRVVLTAGDAAALPYPDDTFDVVVGTFVLCTVGDVGSTLSESRRVLRSGGTIRLLEHGRSADRRVAGLQCAMAPGWARAAGGCRLDHDVRAAIESAGLRIIEQRSYGHGLLVELVTAA